MYASLQSNLNYNEFESAACLVQYSQTEEPAEGLTEDQMLAMASIQTYIGSQLFVESPE